MKQELIPVPGGLIAAHCIGKGKPLVFLHGGPGDTHHYMKRMAEPLFDRYQCIFFDQRGTGESTFLQPSLESFGVDLLFSDALAVKNHFGLDNCTLIGHSWGAMYGLFLTIRYPKHFQKAALISMGPLDEEMAQGHNRNFKNHLTLVEQANWDNLYALRNAARDCDDVCEVKRRDEELMKIRVKSWIFNPDLRESFLLEYHQDPAPNRQVNKWIWQNFQGWYQWKMLDNSNSNLWICAGANDPIPIEQSHKILGIMKKSAELCLFENCGHMPWLEHPESFYSGLTAFLE
jgi:proline iminopeptidase